MRAKKKHRSYVWCAEDEKYGLMAVYATKKAADNDYGPRGKKRWDSGYGGSIIKRLVQA